MDWMDKCLETNQVLRKIFIFYDQCLDEVNTFYYNNTNITVKKIENLK